MHSLHEYGMPGRRRMGVLLYALAQSTGGREMATDEERIAALEARVALLEGLLEEVVSYEVKDGEEDEWITWLYDDWMDRVVEALDEPAAGM
jgi:hypothetical protein